MAKITKDMVLQGYGFKVEVPAPEYGDGAVFVVSPPLASDVSEAKALRMKVSGVKGETELSQIDLGKALVAEESARRFVIAKALTRGMGEEWSLEDIEKIKPPVLSRLWETVDTLTGFSGEAEDEARNFQRAQRDKS